MSIYKYLQTYSWVSRIPRFLPNLSLNDWTKNKKVKELTDICELHDAIQQLFALHPPTYFLQKFNLEFQDFIDMEEGEDIQDKDKIKIIPLSNPQAEPEVTNNTCSLTFSSDMAPSQLPCESILEELQDFVVLPPHKSSGQILKVCHMKIFREPYWMTCIRKENYPGTQNEN